MNVTVMVVDDALIMRTTCQKALERAGFRVEPAESGGQALAIIERTPIAVAVLDIRMPGMSGIELLREIKRRQPDIEVIMMTAYADAEVAEESLNLGAAALLIKPFENVKMLVDAVKQSSTRVRLRRGGTIEDGADFKDILLHSSLVSEDDLRKAQTYSFDKSMSLRRALLSLKMVTPYDLDWAVANYLDIPYVQLNEKMLDPELVHNFPAELARAFTCLPLFQYEDELHVVAANPFDPALAAEIKKALSLTPVLFMGHAPEIKAIIERVYGQARNMEVREIIAKLEQDKGPDRLRLVCALIKDVRFEQEIEVVVESLGKDFVELKISGFIRTRVEE